MKNSLILIQQIKQIDNHSFQIAWTDQKVSVLHLAHVQKHCPCARCAAEKNVLVKPDVKATKITNVGIYALAVGFTSGCSRGVFTFSLLRKLSLEEG